MHTLSEQSKIWIYQADRDILPDELEPISSQIEAFCKQWTAHDIQLHASFLIQYNRFIVLIVDESQSGASGCSIDKSVAFMKKLSADFKMDVFGRLEMAYLDNGKVKTVHLNEVEVLFQNGDINENTEFFNTNIQELNDLKLQFIMPLKDHWLMKKLVQ